MSSSRVIDKDRGYKAFKAFMASVGKVHVVAGVRGQKGSARYSKKGQGDSPPTLVEVATTHEFGEGRVPERSFLRSTFDAERPKYQELLEDSIGRCIDGDADIERELDKLGVRVAGDVTKRIRAGQGIPPPLSPMTIAAKGSTHTLIDTGRLAQSIDSEVRRD